MNSVENSEVLMMTTVNDIYEYIDSFAPFNTAEQWDNVGVLVGNKEHSVKRAVVSLDITSDVLAEAHDVDAQLVISHHPIIFGGIKTVMSGSPVYDAVSYGISCLCAHTNLDKSSVFGVNTALAQAAGLLNCRPSADGEFLFIANTKDMTAPDDLAAQIKKNLNMNAVAFTEYNMEINTVGICSGGGGDEIFSAINHGCDAFITGEIKHHELLAANAAGLSVFILGHYKSEDVVIEPLVRRLGEKFPDVEFMKSKVFSDGVGMMF